MRYQTMNRTLRPAVLGRFLNTCLVAGALLVSLLAAPLASAQPREYNPRDVAMLPNYCKYTQSFRESVPGGDNKAEIDKWYRIMGMNFHHMHHYCWGLILINGATFFSPNRQQKMANLTASIAEFNYVIAHTSRDFVMLPEVYTKRGETLIKLGRGPAAIPDLQRAIELKADYWPPYAAMSDYFKDAGDTATARQWLEKGLAASPDAKALTSRLAELGGKSKSTAASAPAKRAPERPAPPAAEGNAEAAPQKDSATAATPTER